MNEKVNIQDLIDLLAEKHGMGKANADSFVKEFFQLIEEALEKDKYVKIRGLGVFKLIDVDSRKSVNVNTGERFEIQGHTKVSFAPEPSLKDIINKPFSHFEPVVLNDNTVLEDTPIGSSNEDEEGAEQKAEIVMDAAENFQNVEETVCLSETAKANFPEIIVDALEEVEVPQNTENIEGMNSLEETLSSVGTVVFETTTGQEIMKVSSVTPERIVGSEETKEEERGDVRKEASVMRYFIGVVVLVVLLCAGVVVYLYYPDLFNKSSINPQLEKIVGVKTDTPIDGVALVDSVIVKDSVDSVKPDTTLGNSIVESVTKKPDVQVVIKQSAVVNTPKSQSKQQSKVAYTSDSINYMIVGTETIYTIKPGETLTKVALRFYGTKALYPYIVKHNPDVIKKPDNVPAGTTIKIPKLVKK
ncbi:HU family DNA-binding protein [uncultured Bacteroides sp.]|uniref:HU family DNA-binding protein n=1 Tax=uncultured Bacteroides sp. TaxID=162156 RepID=UPI0025D0068B|nr:HU family DNA-binding protein [uncultured Bacteroides sp.]